MTAPAFDILLGDCMTTMRQQPAGSVHACVTSPPYYGLRDYGLPPTDWPAVEFAPMPGLPPITIPPMRCCLGLEPDPWAFVGHLVAVFREVRRLLVDDGTAWVNMGDSYARPPTKGGSGPGGKNREWYGENYGQARGAEIPAGVKDKDLMGMPWRIAFALQADGWVLRQDVIWQKPNPMPESVRDRCTKAHEYVFLLAKRPRYWFDPEAIKEPAIHGMTPSGVGFGHGFDKAPKPRVKVPAGWATHGKQDALSWATPDAQGRGSKRNSFARETKQTAGAHGQKGQHRPDRPDVDYGHTRNKRSVWSVATNAYKGAHFATFPPKLIEPCIEASTSERGHCPDCGKRWTRQVAKRFVQQHDTSKGGAIRSSEGLDASSGWQGSPRGSTYSATTGWRPHCSCGKAPVPDVVFDPFGGTGTTAGVALAKGRSALVCELNAAYADTEMPKRIEQILAAYGKTTSPRTARGLAPINPNQQDLFDGAHA